MIEGIFILLFCISTFVIAVGLTYLNEGEDSPKWILRLAKKLFDIEP